jgi:hypothetical protein
MDLRIEGDSKKPRLVRLFIPITIKGPFMAPKVGLDASGRGQGGVAAALGSLVNAAGRHPALRHHAARPRTPTAPAWSAEARQRRRAGQGGPDDAGQGEEVARRDVRQVSLRNRTRAAP